MPPTAVAPPARAALPRRATVAGAVAVPALVGAVALVGMRRERATAAWVLHTQEVLTSTERMLADVTDAETAQRGYLLTGDTTYLAPSDAGRAAVSAELARLRRLTADNPAQQRRLAAADSLVRLRTAALDETVVRRRRGDAAGAVALVRAGPGRRAMDALRAVVADLRAEELRLLAERRRADAEARRLAVWLLGVGVVSAALLAAALNALVLRHARARDDAAAESDARAHQLEEQAVELERANEQLQEQAQELELQADEVRRLNADLETQVAARTRDLRATNAELEAFTYTVSHDLRAPLRAIEGFARALDDDYAPRLDAEGRRYTAFLVQAAAQMDQLIHDLLTFSRLGRAAVERAPLGLGAVVAEARAQVAGDLAAAGAAVDVDPALDGDGPYALGDRRMAVQAVANLLTNAAKFVRPGASPAMRITVAPAPPADPDRAPAGPAPAGPSAPTRAAGVAGATVCLVVEDQGIGVAAEHRDRIFRVFERLHGADEYPGTGIGLAIVRRAAERVGGDAGVAPAPGGGSRFWICWPALAGRVPGVDAAPAGGERSRPAGPVRATVGATDRGASDVRTAR